MTVGTTEEIRDRLTRSYLAHVGEAPEPGQVRRFRRDWWDGAVRVPTLVVDLERGRCRLVQAGRDVVVLPVNRWRARRAIRRLRRPATLDPRLLGLARPMPDPRAEGRTETTVAPQRAGDEPRGLPTPPQPARDLPRLVVHIEQEADVVRCGNGTCSALVPVPPPGRLLHEPVCPLCGRVELPVQHTSPGTARAVALL